MRPYENVELKTFDDLNNKFASLTVSQCPGAKSVRDFGLDFSGAMDFCDELREIERCLGIDVDDNDPATREQQESVLNTINDTVNSLLSNREDSVLNGFDIWNDAPKNAALICDGIDALVGLMGGSGSFGIGAMVGAIYSQGIALLDTLTVEVVMTVLTELLDSVMSMLMNFICEYLEDAVECLKNNLLAQPWDCLSVVDSSHIEILKSLDVSKVCSDMTTFLADNKIGNIVSTAKTTLVEGTMLLKGFGSAALSSIPTAVDNIYAQPSIASISNFKVGSCRDIAELIDNIVNNSLLGIAVALGQVLYNDYQFLSNVDFPKMANDLLDCIDMIELPELCDIGAKFIDIGGLVASFSTNMLKNMDFLCDITSTLDDLLGDRDAVKRVIHHADDRHSPIRNSSTCASLNFILNMNNMLDNSTVNEIKEWAVENNNSCINMESLIDGLLPYGNIDTTSELTIASMMDVYYEGTKCLLDPDGFKEFITTLNNNLDDLANRLDTTPEAC
jgi:hypothetical protein